MAPRIDPRALLAFHRVYRFFQYLTGGMGARATLVQEYVQPVAGCRILDIGCGTAAVLEKLPHVDYVGLDPSERYIAHARQCFGSRGVFLQREATANAAKDLAPFDLVLAIGVLHHLSDAQARELFALARSALREQGRLVTLDPCHMASQRWVARLALSLDRGKFVRYRKEYEALAQGFFPRVVSHIRSDLLRIPYTHVILQCQT